jgi:CRP/FNR family transcriptional regulator, cyclic AMP receptor protein
MIDAAAMLMDSPLNQVLTAGDAAELVKMGSIRALNRGKYLFKIDDPGNALYVVLQGNLEVVLGKRETGETVVAAIGPGQIVGELEVMTQSVRVASLMAVEEALLLEIPADKLEQLLRLNRPSANKLVAYIAKTLARRLAAVNQRIMAKQPPLPPADAQEEELSEKDLVVDDEDMKVLDKLWG